jgi:hypothetical protein
VARLHDRVERLWRAEKHAKIKQEAKPLPHRVYNRLARRLELVYYKAIDKVCSCGRRPPLPTSVKVHVAAIEDVHTASRADTEPEALSVVKARRKSQMTLGERIVAERERRFSQMSHDERATKILNLDKEQLGCFRSLYNVAHADAFLNLSVAERLEVMMLDDTERRHYLGLNLRRQVDHLDKVAQARQDEVERIKQLEEKEKARKEQRAAEAREYAAAQKHQRLRRIQNELVTALTHRAERFIRLWLMDGSVQPRKDNAVVLWIEALKGALEQLDKLEVSLSADAIAEFLCSELCPDGDLPAVLKRIAVCPQRTRFALLQFLNQPPKVKLPPLPP